VRGLGGHGYVFTNELERPSSPSTSRVNSMLSSQRQAFAGSVSTMPGIAPQDAPRGWDARHIVSKMLGHSRVDHRRRLCPCCGVRW